MGRAWVKIVVQMPNISQLIFPSVNMEIITAKTLKKLLL